MDISDAHKLVGRERARWFAAAAGSLSDDQLLCRHERLFNGITMTLAIGCLVGYFVLPILYSQMGEYASIYGTWGTLVGFFIGARQCSVTANRCRAARKLLNSQLHEPSA
jgi:hypothetical protein